MRIVRLAAAAIAALLVAVAPVSAQFTILSGEDNLAPVGGPGGQRNNNYGPNATGAPGGASGLSNSGPLPVLGGVGTNPNWAVSLLFVVNPDGTFSSYGATATDNGGGPITVGPYDGVEDTLVAVLNNSAAPLTALTLSGPAGFIGFDGDGIDLYWNGTPPPIEQVGNPDLSTYGGPIGSYVPPGSPTATSVMINFANAGVAGGGGSTYFSFELGPAALGGITPGGVPEPASLVMCASGALLLVGGYLRRRRQVAVVQ